MKYLNGLKRFKNTIMNSATYIHNIAIKFGGLQKDELIVYLKRLIEMAKRETENFLTEKPTVEEIKKSKDVSEQQSVRSKLNGILSDNIIMTIETIMLTSKPDVEKAELMMWAFKYFEGNHLITEIPLQLWNHFVNFNANEKFDIIFTEDYLMFKIL